MMEQESVARSQEPGRSLKFVAPALVLVYLALATAKIAYPGLQYDEILWGNAALGCIDPQSFIAYKMGDIPVLLMPYIGAVKSYIYYPIFKVFGVSMFSIRIPTILITAASLYLLFFAIGKQLNQRIALVALFLFSMDPSFIAQTRVDCGPIVLEFCCKVLAIYFLVKLLNKVSSLYLLGLYAVFAFGVFNKLNFIWFLNSFIVASLVYWSEFKKQALANTAGQNLRLLSYNIAGCSVLYGYYLFISKTFGYTKPFIFPFSAARLSKIGTLLKNLITGESFYHYALGDIHSAATTAYFAATVLVLIAALLIVLLKRERIAEAAVIKPFFFFWIIFITTLLQISVTEQASENWHMFSVYPSVTILVATSVAIIGQYLRLQGRALALCAASLAVTSALYCGFINARYLLAYDQPTKMVAWSKAIYELVDFTKTHPYRFVSVDWGIHAQLVTLNPVKDKYYEICYGLTHGIKSEAIRSEEEIYGSLFAAENNLAFIMHAPRDSTLLMPREEMFKAAEALRKKLRLISVISDGGRAVFEIYVPQDKS